MSTKFNRVVFLAVAMCLTAAPAAFCHTPADYNNDGVMDGQDFGVFVHEFNLGTVPPAQGLGDFDFDGDIDGGDFGVFVGEWSRFNSSSTATDSPGGDSTGVTRVAGLAVTPPTTVLTTGVHVISSSVPGHLRVAGAEVTVVLGAEIGSLQLDSGSLTMLGGTVNGTVISDTPTLFIRGGTIGGELVSADFSPNIEISGGQLLGTLRVIDNATLTVVGRDFNYPIGEISDLTGTLTGTLANGDPLSISFQRSEFASLVIRVPEPTGAAMLVIALTMTVRSRCPGRS